MYAGFVCLCSYQPFLINDYKLLICGPHTLKQMGKVLMNTQEKKKRILKDYSALEQLMFILSMPFSFWNVALASSSKENQWLRELLLFFYLL